MIYNLPVDFAENTHFATILTFGGFHPTTLKDSLNGCKNPQHVSDLKIGMACEEKNMQHVYEVCQISSTSIIS